MILTRKSLTRNKGGTLAFFFGIPCQTFSASRIPCQIIICIEITLLTRKSLTRNKGGTLAKFFGIPCQTVSASRIPCQNRNSVSKTSEKFRVKRDLTRNSVSNRKSLFDTDKFPCQFRVKLVAGPVDTEFDTEFRVKLTRNLTRIPCQTEKSLLDTGKFRVNSVSIPCQLGKRMGGSRLLLLLIDYF